MIFLKLLFILTFLQRCFTKAQDDDSDYPKIQSLFKIPEVEKSEGPADQRPFAGREVTVDIQKIDVDKMRRKLDQMPRDEKARQWASLWKNNRNFNMTGNETIPLNDTRRLQIAWIPFWGYDMHYKKYSTFGAKAKIMDIGLQTIYMARHKIAHLEKEKHFNRKDTGYRIAFIYRHLRRLYRRLVNIYMTTKANMDRHYSSSWRNSEHITSLHQRAVRIYVDFLYYYWVMIEIDKRYREEYKIKEPKGPDLEIIRSTTDAFLNYRGFEQWRVWYNKK